MITMGINWPVGEDDIGFFGMQQLDEFGVPLVGDFGAPVDLARKHGASLHDLAGFFGLGRTNSGSFFVGSSRHTCLAAGEINRNDIMAGVRITSNRTTTTTLGIVGVTSRDDNLLAFSRLSRLVRSSRHRRELSQRRCAGSKGGSV